MGGTNERLKMKMTMSLPRKENQNLFSAFCSTMSIVLKMFYGTYSKNGSVTETMDPDSKDEQNSFQIPGR